MTAGSGPGSEARNVPDGDPHQIEESSAVRPYALTGGRTRGHGVLLPIEALALTTAATVPALRAPSGTITGERARILEHAVEQYISIAELSAHLRLPVGVVRVLVADLADEGLLTVAGSDARNHHPAATLRVLESVLNGISAL